MDQSESDLLLEAKRLYDAGDYTNAIAVYQSALEKNRTAFTLERIGISYAMLEDYAAATRWFEAAIQEDGDYASVYRNWGLALARQKNLMGAIEKYKQAIQKDPDFARAYFSWGMVLQEQNDLTGAIEKFGLATQKDPGIAKAYYGWGDALIALNRAEDAVQVYRQAVDNVLTAEEKAYAHKLLGDVFKKQEKNDDAIKEYDAAIALDPSQVNAYYEWGDELTEQPGRLEEAIEKYRKGMDVATDKAQGHRRLGDLYRTNARDEEAIKEYDKAIAIDEANVDIYYQWAQSIIWQREHFDEAVEKYKKAIDVVNDKTRKAEGYERLGDAYRLRSRYEEAIQSYKEALQQDPNHIAAYYGWAGVLMALKKLEEAVEKYREGIRLASDETKVEGYVSLGANLAEHGKFDEAVEQFKQALMISPENDRARDRWAKIIAAKYWNSRKIVDSYIRGLADKGEAYFTLANALVEEKHFAEAIRCYQRAIEINPDHTDAHIGLARAFSQQGDHRKAAGHFEHAIAKGRVELVYELGQVLTHLSAAELETHTRDLLSLLPREDKARGYTQLGDAFRDRGFYEEAIRVYQSAQAEDAGDDFLLNSLGRCFIDSRNYAKAEECYNQIIEQNKDVETSWEAAEAHRMLGWIFYHRTDFEKALENFALAEMKNPGSVDSYIGMAYLRRERGEYELALADLQKAVEKSPNQPRTYLECGFTYETLGDYEKAIEQYRHALDRDQNDPSIHFRLGYVLSDIKRYEESIAAYQKILEMDSVDPLDSNPLYASHNHAYILQSQGKYEEARKKWKSTYEKYCAYMPVADRQRNPDIYQYAAAVNWDFFQEFNAEEQAFVAELLYKKGLEFDPEHTGLLLGLLEFYTDCKQLLEYGDHKLHPKNPWLAQVHSILSRENDSALVRQSISVNWQAMQQYQKLIQILDRRIGNAKSQMVSGKLHAQYYLDRSRANLLVERYENAKQDAQAALALDPMSAVIHATLGVIQMRLEEYKGAIQSFRNAVKLDVDNIGYLSNLAEAYRKADMLDEAKKQYEFALKISPYHLDSLIGIAETYTAIGDGPKDGKRSVDAEEMYIQAIEFYSKALALVDKDHASKILKPHEIAAVRYARGYARTMLFESQVQRDEKLLRDAQKDFESIPSTDKNYQKAKRSARKIADKLRPFSPNNLEQRAGAWVILIAVFVFLVGQFMFFVGQPVRVPAGFAFTDKGVQALQAAGLAEELLVKMSSLSGKFDSLEEFVAKVSETLGEEMTLETQKLIVENIEPVPASINFQAVDVGFYALFTFGPLIFVVAGAYLQQISRLKFAGIEIEKSSVDQISTSSSLGIGR